MKNKREIEDEPQLLLACPKPIVPPPPAVQEYLLVRTGIIPEEAVLLQSRGIMLFKRSEPIFLHQKIANGMRTTHPLHQGVRIVQMSWI
jgi:hypothetical protein